MGTVDVWSTIHAERKALAADLQGLAPDQWTTASLCDGWSVREVLAHMTATAKSSPGRFFSKIISSGFNFTKMSNSEIADELGSSPADTLQRFVAAVDRSSHPPGPNDSWLGEVIVHGEDIRRPLGIAHEYPTDAAVEVADFYKKSNLIIGSKKRIAGVRLVATDTTWASGDGPEVSGPIVALVMAMTGRKSALADLTGDGVATLQSRG